MAAPTANPGLAIGPGDPPMTLAEVAEHYRMTERQLRKVILPLAALCALALVAWLAVLL